MLKQDHPITFVMRDKELREVALARGFEAMLEPSPDQLVPLPAEDMLICVDPEHAAAMAQAMIDAGRPDVLVRWIDDSTAPGGCEKMLDDLSSQQIRVRARLAGCDEILSLADVRETPEALERFDVGYDFLEPHMKIRRNELQIFAGPYGCGKSTVSQAIALKLAMGRMCADREAAAWFCTLEDDPIEQRDQIRRHMHFAWSIGRTPAFQADRETARMQRRIHITRPEWSGERRMDWWEDRARRMHRNYGTNVFILDPWAEMDHDYGHRVSETQYVSHVMRRCRALVNELNVVVQVITHIDKASYSRDGGIQPFRIANSLGSVNFGGKADRGVCVVRTDKIVEGKDLTVLHFDKVKVERTMGRKGTLAVTYDENSHDFLYDADASRAAEESWSGRPARVEDPREETKLFKDKGRRDDRYR